MTQLKLAPTTPLPKFEAVTSLTPLGNGRFCGEVSPEWTLVGKPNGGYLLAMLGRAAAAVSLHNHVVAASAQYLTSPEPGRVTIDTELLRTGRGASQVRSQMRQGGKLCVEALVSTSHFEPTPVAYWNTGAPTIGCVPFEEGIPLIGRLPTGERAAIIEQIDLRLDPDSIGFTIGRPSGRGELKGWLALPDGEPFDPVSLLYAVDAFPPATFDIEFAGWVPTLALTAFVRALPTPGPVRVLQRAQLIDGQRVDEVCFVWDRTGRLVAQATQLAGVRLG